jgi:hypothetical protein
LVTQQERYAIKASYLPSHKPFVFTDRYFE